MGIGGKDEIKVHFVDDISKHPYETWFGSISLHCSWSLKFWPSDLLKCQRTLWPPSTCSIKTAQQNTSSEDSMARKEFQYSVFKDRSFQQTGRAESPRMTFSLWAEYFASWSLSQSLKWEFFVTKSFLCSHGVSTENKAKITKKPSASSSSDYFTQMPQADFCSSPYHSPLLLPSTLQLLKIIYPMTLYSETIFNFKFRECVIHCSVLVSNNCGRGQVHIAKNRKF